jgi:putative membrane protein (TIGR04086 family)
VQDGAGSGRTIDLAAVGVGMIWGLVVLLAGTLTQGVYGYARPLSPETEATMAFVWHVMAGLAGGFSSARRAAGSGWMHGALAGMALVLSLAAVAGVATALPTLATLLQLAGIGTGAGAVGGIIGVNVAGRR